MTRHLARTLSALLALAALAMPALARADPEDIAAASRAVVRVVLMSDDAGQLSLIGHGSGIAVAPDTILTNAHVVEEAATFDSSRVAVVPSAGKSGWFARVAAFSPRNDLALLRLAEPGSLPPATLFAGPLADGAAVFAVGYPGNVDMAQGLNIGDIVSPTPPVKTQGTVSAGRSSKQFDSILHTAPIGAGNSGGPLLDACGRMVGINSFGTLSGEADSEFYFAVSIREIARFLLANRVQPRSSGAPCQSLADYARAQSDLSAGEQSRADLVARKDAARANAQGEAARRAVQFAVITEREDRMALAGLALLLALAAGGTAFFLHQGGRGREARIAGGICALMLAGAAAAWLSRPPLSEIDERTAGLLASGPSPGKVAGAAAKPLSGKLVCVLDSARSRVTVSDSSDLAFSWNDGCSDGKTAFAPDAAGGWSSVTLSEAGESASLASFDPATGIYRIERHYPAPDDMAKLAFTNAKPAICQAEGEDALALTQQQQALRAMLPEKPVETLIYKCRRASQAPS